MLTRQCIHLCPCSFVPAVFCEALACVSALVRGLRSLAFHCVRSCSYACACFELALVNLCNQPSAVVHMRVDPPCLLESLGFSPPPSFPPTPPEAYLFMGTLQLAHGGIGRGC